MFGWPVIPDPIVEATSLLAGRLLIRIRQAPLGVLSLGLEGEAARIGRSDPDVMFLVAPFVAGSFVG
jgi:hypothetical protein